MVNELSVDIYELAHVSNEKYEMVKWSTRVLALALFIITLNISFLIQ